VAIVRERLDILLSATQELEEIEPLVFAGLGYAQEVLAPV